VIVFFKKNIKKNFLSYQIKMNQVPSQNTSTVTIQTNDQEQFQNMLNALAGFRIPKYFISIFLTMLYLILAIYFVRVSRGFVSKIVRKVNNYDKKQEEFHKRKIETIEVISYNVLKIIVWLLAFMFVLSAWGFSIGPLLAGAGIMGVSLGFGAQSFLKDIINGFVILFTGYVTIGDYVEIMKYKGRIVDINLSTTILQTEKGDNIYIPNGSIDVITKLQ
jgi:small-conductance mechanosensitive channel